jgi:hypothetical protein
MSDALAALMMPKNRGMAGQEFRPRFSDEDLAAVATQYPDILRSAGIGVARGAIGVAGVPGDLGDVLNRHIDRAVTGLGNMFGQNWQPAPLGTPLDSEAIQRGVEHYTGKFRKPETPAGEIAEKGGHLAVLMASGGRLANGLKRASRMNLNEIADDIAAITGRRF